MDRRQFGKIMAGGLALGMSGGVSALACDNAKTKQSAPLKPNVLYPDGEQLQGVKEANVVVVGGGLSGLIAARCLVNNGKSVYVLEANHRIGGRMYLNPPDPNYNGQLPPLDLGGQWVGDTQLDMQALVDEFRIEHFLSYEANWSVQSWGRTRLQGFNGDISDLLSGDCEEPKPLDPECKSLIQLCESGRGALWKALLEISKTIPPESPWEAENAKWLDSQTFASWLDNELAKPGVYPTNKAYMHWLSALQARIGGSGGFEPGTVSLLHMAWTQRVGPQAATPEKWLLKGGAGQIPELLAKQLANRIVLSSPVTAINAENTNNIQVIAGGLTIKTKAVIVAIPPPLRAGIEFTPALPPIHNGFIQRSPMGSMTKVHAVYNKPFWRDRCKSGSAVGSLNQVFGDPPTACEFIADSSGPEGGGGPGILTSFISGDRNLALSGLDCTTVQKLVLDDFKYYLDDSTLLEPSYFVRFNWNEQKWSGGAFTSYLPPGAWTTYGKGLRENVGHIYWAGTETSDRWPGYFDGAIRAGKTAALAALKDVFNITGAKECQLSKVNDVKWVK